MLITKDVKIYMRRPWWSLVKNEVARAIAIRIKTQDSGLKPKGSILGQMFVDFLNELPELRKCVHYLTTRKWPEIVSDIESDISPEMLEVFNHDEGAKWFSEFQKFVIWAWEKSCGPEQEQNIFDLFDEGALEIIRKEWLLHLEKGAPELLAGVMLEWMRDANNHHLRKAAVTACAFVSVRPWNEVLEVLRERFKSMDLSGLDRPEAAAFYERFKMLIQLPVRQYWNQLVQESRIEADHDTAER